VGVDGIGEVESQEKLVSVSPETRHRVVSTGSV
jgi:hypothetical protein